jgi:hypothetical protein
MVVLCDIQRNFDAMIMNIMDEWNFDGSISWGNNFPVWLIQFDRRTSIHYFDIPLSTTG